MEKCFLGCYTHTLDSQRRVAIPKDWRNVPGVNDVLFYLIPGRHKSIQILPKELFETEILAKIKKVSFADDEKTRALGRIGSRASQSICDKQGRITLTKELMDHAGLTNQAVLIGALTTIQIMTPETWAENDMGNDEMLDQILKIHNTEVS